MKHGEGNTRELSSLKFQLVGFLFVTVIMTNELMSKRIVAKVPIMLCVPPDTQLYA